MAKKRERVGVCPHCGAPIYERDEKILYPCDCRHRIGTQPTYIPPVILPSPPVVPYEPWRQPWEVWCGPNTSLTMGTATLPH